MDKYEAPPDMPHLRTLSYAIEKEVKKGYIENFMITEDGLKTTKSEKIYSPDQISIVDFYRFEGASDPDDNAILYVIETDDGVKGTVVDAYGADANSTITAFILDVERISKKNAVEK